MTWYKVLTETPDGRAHHGYLARGMVHADCRAVFWASHAVRVGAASGESQAGPGEVCQECLRAAPPGPPGTAGQDAAAGPPAGGPPPEAGLARALKLMGAGVAESVRRIPVARAALWLAVLGAAALAVFLGAGR